MSADEIASYITTAAASGIVGNRADDLLTNSAPVQAVREWFRRRLIDPKVVVPSPATDAWLDSLSSTDRADLASLLQDAIRSVPSSGVHAAGGVAVGSIAGNVDNLFHTQHNHYGTSEPPNGWEYATINYCQEGDLWNAGETIWVADISWPGVDRYDRRERVRIEDLLNELGRMGWRLSSQEPGRGIRSTSYVLRRPQPS